MRTSTLAVTALLLFQLAAAQPFGRRHVNQHMHVKKNEDFAVATVIETVYATGVPEVIVFVNQFGRPLSTMSDGMLAAFPSVWVETTTVFPSSSSTTLASPSSSSSSASFAVLSVIAGQFQQLDGTFSSSTSDPSPEPPLSLQDGSNLASDQASSVLSAVAPPSPPPPPVSVPLPPPLTSSSVSPLSPASSAPSPPPATSGYGFSYSPYRADGSCKSQSQVNQDFSAIAGGYGFVRIYGTDCNQVVTVLSVAKARGLKLFAGVFNLAALDAEIAIIVNAAAGDWSAFDTISIGNELVNFGAASVSAVVTAIGTARILLRRAGYTGHVVTVDTLVAAKANPSLCDASDYCAVNSHPFFDGKVPAADSGNFLTTQIGTLRSVLANKSQRIVITETGWPTQGGTNGLAIPSVANQAAALSSIKAAFANDQAGVILFTVYNDLWKTSGPAQFGAEQFWGFLGNAPSG